jgi:hypothetical protein
MKLKLLPLLIIGGVGLVLYKASSAQAQAISMTPAAGGATRTTLPGITIPSRVRLSQVDVRVARSLINTDIRYILPDGSTVKIPNVPRYLDAGPLTAAQRLTALQSAINSIDYDLRYGDAPQARLFDTLMGDTGN